MEEGWGAMKYVKRRKCARMRWSEEWKKKESVT
jgi:hypothetical protein